MSSIILSILLNEWMLTQNVSLSQMFMHVSIYMQLGFNNLQPYNPAYFFSFFSFFFFIVLVNSHLNYFRLFSYFIIFTFVITVSAPCHSCWTTSSWLKPSLTECVSAPCPTESVMRHLMAKRCRAPPITVTEQLYRITMSDDNQWLPASE